jgi:hypothetical protein
MEAPACRSFGKHLSALSGDFYSGLTAEKMRHAQVVFSVVKGTSPRRDDPAPPGVLMLQNCLALINC